MTKEKEKKLSKDDKNRLAKWRQRLQRHFWSETDEAIFQKILDMNEVQAEPSEEWYKEKAIEIYNHLYYKTFNLNQAKDFIRNLAKEARGTE